MYQTDFTKFSSSLNYLKDTNLHIEAFAQILSIIRTNYIIHLIILLCLPPLICLILISTYKKISNIRKKYKEYMGLSVDSEIIAVSPSTQSELEEIKSSTPNNTPQEKK